MFLYYYLHYALINYIVDYFILVYYFKVLLAYEFTIITNNEYYDLNN